MDLGITFLQSQGHERGQKGNQKIVNVNLSLGGGTHNRQQLSVVSVFHGLHRDEQTENAD